MTTQIEAMKLALEALENAIHPWETEAAITALHKAIEQAQKQSGIPKIGCVNHDCDKCQQAQKQEPVAWLWELTGEVTTDPDRADGLWLPLYTSPPQRQPLTQKQINQLIKDAGYGEKTEPISDFINGIYFAEAAHGITGE